MARYVVLIDWTEQGVANFKDSMKKAQQQIAELEKYDLPLALYEVFDQVKTGLAA